MLLVTCAFLALSVLAADCRAPGISERKTERPSCSVQSLNKEYLKCADDGSFEAVQCKGKKCVCVTKEGRRISRFRTWGDPGNMDCKCARHRWHTKNLRGNTYYCTRNGNFAPKQCIGSVCYCSDRDGKQVGEVTVPISEIRDLDCSSADDENSGGQNEREVARDFLY